ncbi:MAG TPA: sigma-70 family RNA polymerase sigma factor, partial [Acidimicrobiales bacterium]
MESDSALVRAVQEGDLEAYSELFRRHYPAVQRACARRMACPLEAEEIAQGAFVRALERIDQCRGDRQFGGWVQIIARHMCVDALRARSRVVPTEWPMSEDHADGNEPHDSLLDRERTMEVRRALDSLPPRQRQAVEARAEGTGPSEIADDLGLSVGAVDSLILRGRRRLAVAYHRVAGEGGATATATTATATAAASLLAAFSLGSARLLGGVAAAAEAGRDLVAPVAEAAAGAVMAVAVAIGAASPPAPSEPVPTPADRPPAVVVSAPAPAGGSLPALPAGTPAAGSVAAPTAAPGSPQPVTAGNPSGGSLAPAATGAPASGATPAAAATSPAPAAGPTADGADAEAPVTNAVAPVVEPVADVVEATVPVVGNVVETVGDTAND